MSGNLVWTLCAAWALSGCGGEAVNANERANASADGSAGVGTGGSAGLSADGSAGLVAGGRAGLGTGGNGGFVAPSGCLDAPPQLSPPVVSFEQDVMPIFGLSCIASTCHTTQAMKAGLVLGDYSACGPPGTSCYDPNAKWKFTFKAGIPRDLLTAVYAGLVNAPSRIVSAVKLVAPGDPDASFLLDTVTGAQNSKWYTSQCVNTDPAIAPGACGSDMPLNSLNWCADGDPLSIQRVQALAAWIAQGAPMN